MVWGATRQDCGGDGKEAPLTSGKVNVWGCGWNDKCGLQASALRVNKTKMNMFCGVIYSDD